MTPSTTSSRRSNRRSRVHSLHIVAHVAHIRLTGQEGQLVQNGCRCNSDTRHLRTHHSTSAWIALKISRPSSAFFWGTDVPSLALPDVGCSLITRHHKAICRSRRRRRAPRSLASLRRYVVIHQFLFPLSPMR